MMVKRLFLFVLKQLQMISMELYAAQAIVTSRGGMTSHAAVVARGMGKACICGCEALKIDLKAKQFSVGDTTVKYGDIITIDGSTGEIMLR